MMKKNSLLLCSILCLTVIMAACQPGVTPTSEVQTPTVSAPTVTPKPLDPTATKLPEINVDMQKLNGTQITFLHPWSGDTAKMMDILVNEFNQNNEWDIHVKIEEPGSMGLALEELGSTGTGDQSVDMAALPLSALLSADQDQRGVVDLNAYVHSSTYGFSEEELADFYPVFWNSNLVNGKLYAIPVQETASVLFYNVTWAEELGYTKIPLTSDDFRAQTCAANALFRKDNDRSNDGLGGWIINEDASVFMNWLKAFNGLEMDQPITSFSSTETETSFEYLFNLQKDACAWDSRFPEPYDYFAKRQALVYSGTLRDILPQTAAFERAGSTDEWKVILYPSQSGATLLTEGISFGVLESSADKQLAAWLFIRYVSEPMNQARLLKTSGTFPIGKNALAQSSDLKADYPQWNETVNLLPFASAMPEQTNSHILRMTLSDAVTYMLKPEFKLEQLPALLEELDATIQELSERLTIRDN